MADEVDILLGVVIGAGHCPTRASFQQELCALAVLALHGESQGVPGARHRCLPALPEAVVSLGHGRSPMCAQRRSPIFVGKVSICA